MGPARLDQEFRPATVRCTRRTHCTLPFTRGTLMRVRADETNTLEISAGHSPVGGAHSSSAGGSPGACRGGLPGSNRNLAGGHQRGLPQRRQLRRGLQEQVRRALQQLRRAGLAGRLVPPVPLRHGHGSAELGCSPDRQHPRQGLLPAQGRQQRHRRRGPAGRRRHRHRLQPGRGRRHDRAGQTGHRTQPAADRLGHRTGQRRGPARLRHLQHLRDPGGRCAVGQHRRQEPEPQQRRRHQQQLRRPHAQRSHHAEGRQRRRRSRPRRPARRTPARPRPAKTIAEIQGTGAASPLAGSSVTTRGRVTATFPTGGFAGYYVQTPGTGGDLTPANHAASDAVFVYSPVHGRLRQDRRLRRAHRRRQRILRHDPAERRRGGRSEEAHRGRPRGQGHRLRPPGRRGLP